MSKKNFEIIAGLKFPDVPRHAISYSGTHNDRQIMRQAAQLEKLMPDAPRHPVRSLTRRTAARITSVPDKEMRTTRLSCERALSSALDRLWTQASKQVQSLAVYIPPRPVIQLPTCTAFSMEKSRARRNQCLQYIENVLQRTQEKRQHIPAKLQYVFSVFVFHSLSDHVHRMQLSNADDCVSRGFTWMTQTVQLLNQCARDQKTCKKPCVRQGGKCVPKTLQSLYTSAWWGIGAGEWDTNDLRVQTMFALDHQA